MGQNKQSYNQHRGLKKVIKTRRRS